MKRKKISRKINKKILKVLIPYKSYMELKNHIIESYGITYLEELNYLKYKKIYFHDKTGCFSKKEMFKVLQSTLKNKKKLSYINIIKKF